MKKFDKNFILFRDNRGASVLIVLAIFMVAAVVAGNLAMMVNSNSVSTRQDFDEQQARMYSSSIYQVMNGAILEGKFNSYFVSVTGTPAGGEGTDPEESGEGGAPGLEEPAPGETPGEGGEEPGEGSGIILGVTTSVDIDGFTTVDGDNIAVALAFTPIKGGTDVEFTIGERKIYATYRYMKKAGGDITVTQSSLKGELEKEGE